jgi:hypothetical protein
MDLSNYTKQFHKLLAKKPRGHHEIDPERAWKQIVLTFAIINLLVIGLNSFLFWKISRGEIFINIQSPSAPAHTLDRTELTQTVNYYDAQAAKLQTLESAKPALADPSL